VEALVRVCEQATTNGALASGAGALRKLAMIAENREEIAGAPGAVAALVRVCREGGDDAAMEAGAGALRNLATNDRANKAAIAREPGALAVLVRVCRDARGDGAVEAGAGALENLALLGANAPLIHAAAGAHTAC
jgi:hypothetical protein